MAARPATPSLLRTINDRSAFDLLLTEGPMTRVELGKRTGLSKVTASQLLARLQRRGLVEVVGSRSAGRGPSAEVYAVRPGCSFSVGVDLNPDHADVAIADVTGTTAARLRRPVNGATDPKGLIHDTVAEVTAEAGLELSAVDQVVIGMPGVVDPATGDIQLSFDLPGWHRGLREVLAADLGCELTFENDVNLAAVAERAEGAGRDVDDLVLLWVGRGVGLAVVLGGRLHRGATGAAGEIGYLPMPGVTSRARVDRPAEGAFQGLVGAGAVMRLAADHGIEAPDAATAVRVALAGGHEAFLRVLADRLALGVAAVCAVVDPALVILSGEIGATGGDQLCRLLAGGVRHIAPVHPRVVSTEVEEPVLRGAVLAAVDRARRGLFSSVTQP